MKVKRLLQKTALAWLQLLVVMLLAANPANAAETFDHGLLWKIQGGGAAPSYLFGTMHSEDPEVVRLPTAVQQAFDKSRGLTLEVVLDPQSLLAMTSGFMLGDGSTLESHIGASLYKRVVSAMAVYGMPEMVVSTMKPWAVAVTLMTPPGETGVVLDLHLYQRAVAAGKPVDGLETPLEQLSVFDELSESDQVALLKDTLDNLPDVQDMLDDLKNAYLARDLARLAAINDAAMRPAAGRAVHRQADYPAQPPHGRAHPVTPAQRRAVHRRGRPAPAGQGRPAAPVESAGLHADAGLLRQRARGRALGIQQGRVPA